jgi:hypothetical protein
VQRRGAKSKDTPKNVLAEYPHAAQTENFCFKNETPAPEARGNLRKGHFCRGTSIDVLAGGF